MWINNNRDIHDTLEIIRTGKLTLWCIGVGPKAAQPRCNNDSKSDTSDTEFSKGNASHFTKKKKKTGLEERESWVIELKKQLREKHGSAYSDIQFTIWAETIAAGNHEGLDNPPTGILNFGSHPQKSPC